MRETGFCLLSKSISRKGPRNCRSLGFARDDKKERVVVKRGSLPRDRAVVGVGVDPLANALSLQQPSPFCHPERSRGICSSADLSWKCFFVPSFRRSKPRPCLNSALAFPILLVYLGGLCRSDEETLPTFSNSQRAWTEELRAHRGGVLTFARHLSKHGGTYESQQNHRLHRISRQRSARR
jgi:hypothetical protein